MLLVEEDGTLSGEIIEPNSFAATAGNELLAVLNGYRDGFEVAFIKTYTDIDNENVQYDGTVNEELTRITGEWVIASPHPFCGNFTMSRMPDPASLTRKIAEKVTP